MTVSGDMTELTFNNELIIWFMFFTVRLLNYLCDVFCLDSVDLNKSPDSLNIFLAFLSFFRSFKCWNLGPLSCMRLSFYMYCTHL